MANPNSYHEEYPFDLQADDLNMASMAQSDFDLAYRLQLEEALRASRDDPGLHHHLPDFPLSPDDRSLAFALQNMELSRSQQQASDLRHMAIEGERLHQDLRLRANDARFAQTLNELNHSDWESHGELCEDPFEPDHEDEPSPTCKLYVTAVISGDASVVPATVGAVLLDSQGLVMTEMRKPLDVGTGKLAAEYMALIAGLETVIAMGVRHVQAYTDSVLVYNQVTRRWKVRSRRFQGLCTQVVELAHKFQQFDANLVPRSENNHAVRLAREAINSQLASDKEDIAETTEVKEVCIICLEGKSHVEMCSVSGCSHGFCLSCIVQHTEVKVQAGQVPVRCPQVGCSQTLSLAQCRSILSQKWFALLNKRLIEVNMPDSERVYCPFPNCSALMNRKDIDASNEGASTSSLSSVTATRCVECHRMFCVECRVPWHVLMSCQQYQQLPPSLRDAQDAKLYQLAAHKNWQRCKKCRRMIELAEGCFHMTCRCGYEFCYLCGEPWKNKRQSCRCRLWDEDFLLDEPLSESEEDELEGWEEFLEDFEADYEDSEDFNELNARFINNTWPPRNNPYYKTQLCRYWERGCYHGDDCKFAHGVHELRGNRDA